MNKQESSNAITYLGLFLALVAPSIYVLYVLFVGPYVFESFLNQTIVIIIGLLVMWLLKLKQLIITRNTNLSNYDVVHKHEWERLYINIKGKSIADRKKHEDTARRPGV